MIGVFHKPVMVLEVMSYLLEREREIIADCTVGDGGHSEAILDGTKNTFVVAIDVDTEAVETARTRLRTSHPGRALVAKGDYRCLGKFLSSIGVPRIDGALLDLGVSSRHMDVTERGFSYWGEGPLDMRMNKEAPVTAGHILATYSEEELGTILRDYGEERFWRRVARQIVLSREEKPLCTAEDLVGIIKRAIPARYRQGDIHPARRTFQALRIATNDEISRLGVSIERIVSHLRPQGAVVILSYHSLEDRIVKSVFKQMEQEGRGKRLTKKPRVPSEAEVSANPRARSAKLRAFVKAEADGGVPCDIKC